MKNPSPKRGSAQTKKIRTPIPNLPVLLYEARALSAIAMANKLVAEMRLPPHLAHLLAARRLTTAKVTHFRRIEIPSACHR